MRRAAPLYRCFALVVALSAITACGSSDATSPPTGVAGSWAGTATQSGITAAISATLAQTGTVVTGTGTANSVVGSLPLTFAGTYTAPHLVLTVSSPGFPDGTLDATISGNTLTGTISAFGFTSAPVSATRN